MAIIRGANIIWGIPEGLNEGEYVIRFGLNEAAKVKTDKGYAPLLQKLNKGSWELGLVTTKTFNGLDSAGNLVWKLFVDDGKTVTRGNIDKVIKIVENN